MKSDPENVFVGIEVGGTDTKIGWFSVPARRGLRGLEEANGKAASRLTQTL